MKYLKLSPSRGEFRILDLVLNYGCKFILKLIPSIRSIVRIFDDADLIICAPGGICMGGFMNWEHIYILQIAKIMDKPIAYFGRSIGPFSETTESDRKFLKYSFDLLHYFDFISLRDNKSVKIALNENIDCVSTVDTAFLDSPMVDIPFRIHKQINGARFVVFVPNSLTWHYSFKKFSQELIDSFFIGLLTEILKSDSEIKILLLPQLHSFMHKDDKYYFAYLVEKLRNDRIELIDDMYGSDIQQSIISKAEYVVGARYHSVVFAINQAVPFISLSYEHKMKGLLETLGVEDCLVDITKVFSDDNSVNTAIMNVMSKINNFHQIKSISMELQHKAKSIANNGFDKFKSFIDTINTIN